MDVGTSDVALHITDTAITANHVLVYDNAVVPTNAKHLIAKEYADNNFYTNTTTLDDIADPTADLNMNGYKISNLGSATSGTDALSRDAADLRYY